MNEKYTYILKKHIEKIDNIFLNRLSLTIFLIFIPLIIAIFMIYLLKPNSSDIINNLISELIGASIIILLFTIIIDVNEKRKWKRVENRVYNRLSSSLLFLYWHLETLCETVYDYQRNELNKNLDFEQISKLNSQLDLDDNSFEGNNLKFLTKKENIRFTELGKKRLLLKDEYIGIDPEICYKYGYTLDKYFSFLEPSLVDSILEIEDNLNNLFGKLWVIENMGVPDSKGCEVYFDAVKEILVNIFKEIKNLEDYSGLKIVQ